MKNNIILTGLQELRKEEAISINGGGSFAYDVGRAFRFLGIAFVHGIPSALTDAAVHSCRC